MNRRHGILGLILLGTAVGASACGNDGDDTAAGGSGGTSSAGHGGSASQAAGQGGAVGEGGDRSVSIAGATSEAGNGNVGAAGTTSQGEAGNGNAGAAGAASQGEAGAGPVATGPLNPHAVVVTASSTDALAHLLVAGTDYSTSTEVVSVALDPAAVGSGHTYADGDAVPASSAGLGFVLERSNDQVHLLDGGAIKTSFDLTKAGTGAAVDIANKAYVALYGRSLVSVLDLAAGTVAGRIDLTEFNAAGDSDGSADITAGAYDATKKVAYFLLERIDLNAIAADPNFHLPCTETKALVVGVDATTDAVVDLNGSADGKALALTLVNPTTLSLAADGKSLTVLANGCYDGPTLQSQGVEVLDLTAGTSKIAYGPGSANADYLSDLILLDGSNALLNTADATFTSHWYKLDLSTGTRGAELLNVPHSPSYDGTDLLGISIVGKVGSVVRYTITTDSVAPVTATSWSGQYSSASGTALVK